MDAVAAVSCPGQSNSTPHTTPTPVVFVVDDDKCVREALKRLIRSTGWEPQTFASAQEFLALPRKLVPSCLILDVGLPDLNGLELNLPGYDVSLGWLIMRPFFLPRQAPYFHLREPSRSSWG